MESMVLSGFIIADPQVGILPGGNGGHPFLNQNASPKKNRYNASPR